MKKVPSRRLAEAGSSRRGATAPPARPGKRTLVDSQRSEPEPEAAVALGEVRKRRLPTWASRSSASGRRRGDDVSVLIVTWCSKTSPHVFFNSRTSRGNGDIVPTRGRYPTPPPRHGLLVLSRCLRLIFLCLFPSFPVAGSPSVLWVDDGSQDDEDVSSAVSAWGETR